MPEDFFTRYLRLPFMKLIFALLILIVAFIVSGFVRKLVEKGLKKINFSKFARNQTPEQAEKTNANLAKSLSTLAYVVVFILFLPAIFDLLQMPTVSIPITNMMASILEYIPNIIIAIIVMVIGVFLCRLVKTILKSFLDGVNIDKHINRFYPKNDGEKNNNDAYNLSTILSNIVFGLLLIPFITVALESLKIESLTRPIVSMLEQILGMVPHVFVAILLLIAGYFIGQFVSEILTSLLKRSNLEKIYDWAQVDDNSRPKFDLSVVIGNIVKIVIIIFFTVEAFNVLNLQVFNAIGEAVILYMPLLLSGLVILAVGVFLANFLDKWIRKYTGNKMGASLVKITIIVFTVFMTLEQLQFASRIVNTGFILILAGISVAFALAFGIGGREFAKSQLKKFEIHLDKKASKKDEQE